MQNKNETFFENQYDGAFDNRTEKEKEKDFLQKEIVAAASMAPVNWVRKTKDQFRSFPVINQIYTFKCVAFTLRKIAGVLYFLRTGKWMDFSASFPYEFRQNKPGGGMMGIDAFDIWRKKGMTLEELCPSTQTYDSDPVSIDEFATKVAEPFALGEHIGIDAGDFDAVCSTIQQTKKAIMVWFYFTTREWSLEVPRVMDSLSSPYDARASRHSVAGIDNGLTATDVVTLADGTQVLKIEDSAHFGGLHTRYITREFFQARNYFARYPMNFKYNEVQPETKPQHQFNKDLQFSAVFNTDPEVVALQDCLKWDGCFPINTDSTGYFGAVTKTAVQKFQVKYGIAKPGDAGYGRVGPMTRAKLNEIF